MLKTFCVIVILLIQCVSSLKIVSDIITGNAACASQCAGYLKPHWTMRNTDMFTDIDISKCGFISPPVFTVSLYTYWYVEGRVVDVRTTWIRYFAELKEAYIRGLYWIAIGYVC